MEFDNTFTVKAPIDAVWSVMTDAREVAPCVPGAQITETVDETHHKGTVKIKLGAVQMSYRGELEMQPDEANHTIVLRAKGTETRGSGGASGVITNRLSEPGPGTTRVDIHSQIDVTGRVAQFGRGIMQDVATRLIKDFAACLESKVSASPEPEGQEATEEFQSAPPAQPEKQSGAASQSSPAGSAATTKTVTAPRPQAGQSEISALALMGDIARSRLASLLRLAAEKIEPS